MRVIISSFQTEERDDYYCASCVASSICVSSILSPHLCLAAGRRDFEETLQCGVKMLKTGEDKKFPDKEKGKARFLA